MAAPEDHADRIDAPMSSSTITMLAHQGGWDEILLVAGPILIIAFLLRLAKRRVDRAAAEAERLNSHEISSDGVGDVEGSQALDSDALDRGPDTA